MKFVPKILYDTLTTEKYMNIGHGLIVRIISVLISLLTLPFILKYLGVSDYAWIGIYTAIVSAIYLFDFGLTSLITKEISQNSHSSKDKLQTIFASQELIYLLIGVLIFLTIFLSSEWLAIHWLQNGSDIERRIHLYRLIAIATLLQWPHSFYTGTLFSLQKQFISNNAQLVLTILKSGGILFLFAYLGASAEIFFYWQITISVLTILLQKYLIQRELNLFFPFQFFSFSYIKTLKRLAIGISFISLFGFVYGDITNLILARWLSNNDYSLYAILYNILVAFSMYSATVKSALFPYISQTVFSKLSATIHRNYIQHFKILSLSIIPVSLMLCLYRDEILHIWLQQKHVSYTLSISFVWIVTGSALNALMIISWSYLISLSKTRYLIYVTGILAFISIPLLFFLIQNYQLLGATAYWAVINFILLPFVLMHCHKQIQMQSFTYLKDSILLPTILTLAILLLTKGIANYFNLNVILHFFTGCLSLFLCYFLIYVVNRCLLNTEKANVDIK